MIHCSSGRDQLHGKWAENESNVQCYINTDMGGKGVGGWGKGIEAVGHLITIARMWSEFWLSNFTIMLQLKERKCMYVRKHVVSWHQQQIFCKYCPLFCFFYVFLVSRVKCKKLKYRKNKQTYWSPTKSRGVFLYLFIHLFTYLSVCLSIYFLTYLPPWPEQPYCSASLTLPT